MTTPDPAMTTPTTTETKFHTLWNLTPEQKALAAKAGELHADAVKHAQKAILFAIQCGHVLLQVRDACKHGEWMPFLEEAGIIHETARRYMGVAEAFDPNSKLLLEGKSLADLYRSLGFIKPAGGGGNRLGGEELARWRNADQMTFHLDVFESCFGELSRYTTATGHTNPFESLDRPTLDTTREQLLKALTLVDEALAAN